MRGITTVESVALSDYKQFSDLVDAYYGSLIAFTFNMLGDMDQAEDIVQDVFVNLWLHRKSIDSGASLKNYIYVSARNAVNNHFRSSRRARAHLRDLSSSDDSVIYMIEEESNRILLSAIDRLPENYSRVIRFGLEGLRQDEIARVMDISLATVKSLKGRALRMLRGMIEGDGV